MQVKLESTTAVNVADELKIENAIDGQYEVMLAYLRFDGESNEIDSFDDQWNSDKIRQRNEATVNVALTTTVFDESGKFNLRQLAAEEPERRKLAKERLMRLLQEARRETSLELSSGDAETWANNIAEYIQKGAVRANIPSAKTKEKDRTILILDELQFLPEVDDHRISFLLADQRTDEDEVAPGLHRFLTVYGDGKLNLNTTPEEVLRAYFPRNPEIAERITEHRSTPPEDEGDTTFEDSSSDEETGNAFKSVEEVNQLDGVDPPTLKANEVDLNLDFGVSSSFFSVRILGETQTSRRDELFVVERVASEDEEEPVAGFRLLLRQERTDILEQVSDEG
jgi:type II secretory pathway component PulK